MGQGQEQATIDALRRASTDGHWLCLQNVHLMLSIIPVIEKVCTEECTLDGRLASNASSASGAKRYHPARQVPSVDDHRGGEQVSGHHAAAEPEGHV